MQSMTTERRRARDLGIAPGRYAPGSLNAITDVPGVRVGQVTLEREPDLHTGVTAIVPDQLRERATLPAGLFVGNGYGKLVGATQLAELGEIETPIVLTGTLSAFRAADALVTYMLGLPGNEEMRSVNPVVGETNDGFLSDIRSRPIDEAHVLEALREASHGPVAEGCVGAGAGTRALGVKAGIGTASRVVAIPELRRNVIVGVLAQANFGGTLTVLGVPIEKDAALRSAGLTEPSDGIEAGNSCMIVVATDAPLDARQLTRLATRAVFGMARVGSDYSHGSGDYGIAFSVGEGAALPGGAMDPLFHAVQEAVEEALLNSLFMAETTHGIDGHARFAVPLGYVMEMLRRRGAVPRSGTHP
jgi:D-aminopeptidase